MGGNAATLLFAGWALALFSVKFSERLYARCFRSHDRADGLICSTASLPISLGYLFPYDFG